MTDFAPTDPLATTAKGYTTPADTWVAVTKSDTVNIPLIPRAVICTTAGNIVFVDGSGNLMTIAMTSGQILAIRPLRVNSTNTTGAVSALY